MILFKRGIAIFLSVLLGLIFLYSGYTKLLPVIETFEFTFVDIGVANWYTAPLIARLLIGLELFLGILLIMNYRLKKLTLPFTIVLLSVFILYLVAQIFMNGDHGNCGCFGEHLKMTPLQGIVKNIFMLGACVLISFWYTGWQLRRNGLLTVFLLVTALTLPFIVNPVDYAYTSNNLDEKVNYPLDLDLLYHPEDTAKVQVPSVDLRKGKQVIAFLSLTCPHCRIAAKKFRLIKKNDPAIPVYFILNGDKKNYADFIEDTRADNIPSSYCLGRSFVKLATTSLPRIYYLDNGIVVKKADYFELNQYAIEKWLKE